MRGGVVVQFAPEVADLAGLVSAVTTALPGATLKLGAEGVLQLGFNGTTYVLKPGWTGAGVGTGAGTHRIGVDEQGRIVFQVGTGPRQLLLPALLSTGSGTGHFQRGDAWFDAGRAARQQRRGVHAHSGRAGMATGAAFGTAYWRGRPEGALAYGRGRGALPEAGNAGSGGCEWRTDLPAQTFRYM